jgi:hypothetical protein
MMKAAEARAHFHGAERLNCAQAVMKTFQTETLLSEADLGAASSAGGGRAEGGLCGALHAARFLLVDSEALPALENEFETQAGARHCREIRQLGRLSCRECVGLSAKLVQPHLAEKSYAPMP